MEFGICLQSVVAVRSDPSHKSEMVTQLLFGELFRVRSKDSKWLRIELAYDDYKGWILAGQSFPLEEPEFLRLLNAETQTSLDLVQLLTNETQQSVMPLILGSSLPGIDGQRFLVGDTAFSFDGLISDASTLEKAVTIRERQISRQSIIDDAMLYLNAPYLWGGRTPFGIDCSGFVQMVYKLKKIKLLRDASQQAMHGEPLNFVSEAEPGDLAFFDNEEGNITHVGLMMDNHRIIHASGNVHIDPIDHQGIYSEREKRYTHKLRVIKRIV